MIKKTFTKNKYNYELIKHQQIEPTTKRTKRIKAIYKQSKSDLLYYEVVILRWVNGEFKTGYKYPSTNEWGSFGWTYLNEHLAQAKFDSI